MGLLLVEYGENCSTVYRIEKLECGGIAPLNETSALVPLENIIAQSTISTGRAEKMK